MFRSGLIAAMLVTASGACAQSIATKVTGAAGGASATGGAAASLGGSPLGGVGAESFTGGGAGGNSSTGGDVAGGFGMKVGDKVIKFRGAVGVGDDRSNARVGAAVPF